MGSIISMLTMQAFWEGALTTIILFASTLIISIPLGLPFALGSNSKILPIKWVCKFYIWVLRGTPLMLQLFFFNYFVFPYILKIPRVPTLTIAIVAFALNYAAYFAEIYRGGIESIDNGQHEASRSLGMSKSRTMFGVILPQTAKVVLPAVFNETITLIKDTALASVIAVIELMRVTKSQVSGQANPLLYIAPALFYLLCTFLITLLAQALEKRFSRHQERRSDI